MARRPRRRPRGRARPSGSAPARISSTARRDGVAPVAAGARPGRTVNDDGERRAADRRRARAGSSPGRPTVVTHRVPSSATPTIDARARRASRCRWNGRAPKATGPVPGRPTSSSTSIDGQRRRRRRPASRSRSAVAAAGEADAVLLEQRRRRAPATASRSTSPSSRRVRATSVTAAVPVRSWVMPATAGRARDVGEPGAARAWRACRRRRAGRRPTSAGSGRRPPSEQQTADARHDLAEVDRRGPSAGRGFVGSATSSSAMRPPGRSTRASSAKNGVEVDEVAQREPARDAVDRAVGHRQAEGVGLDAAARGAGGGQHAERQVDADRPRARRAAARGRSRRCRRRGRARRRPAAGASVRVARLRHRTSRPNVMTRFTRS